MQVNTPNEFTVVGWREHTAASCCKPQIYLLQNSTWHVVSITKLLFFSPPLIKIYFLFADFLKVKSWQAEACV